MRPPALFHYPTLRLRTILSAIVFTLGIIETPIAYCRSESSPNILLILVDDLGWRDCGFMGSDFYETPHLDALAAQGMIFTDAYAAAANCAPSRASLMSGQWTPRHQIFNVGTRLRGNPKYSHWKHIAGTDTLHTGIVTWANCLQAAGYHVGTIGKWHLSRDPLEHGFTFNFAGSHAGGPPGGYFPPHSKLSDLAHVDDDECLTDRLTRAAEHFIVENADRPWALALSHFAVHTPLQTTPELLRKYENKPVGELHNTPVMGGMIESLDTGVGQLVAALDRLNLTEKTVIVFTSDNGGYGPATSMEPLRGYKGNYYEGGIRVPFVVKWPGVVPAGSRCQVPITSLDLFPTFCDIASANPPRTQPQDGISLLPLLRTTGNKNAKLEGRSLSAQPFHARALFWHFPAYLESYSGSAAKRTDGQRDALFRTRPCSVIRWGDWKLHEWFEDGQIELYNLRDDIGERTNLAASLPEKRDELYAKLVSWRRETEAPVPSIPNPKYDADAEGSALLLHNNTPHLNSQVLP